MIALNDDHYDAASGLNTDHADSYLMVKLPADGKYYIHLGDTMVASASGKLQDDGIEQYFGRADRTDRNVPNFDTAVAQRRAGDAKRDGIAIEVEDQRHRRDQRQHGDSHDEKQPRRFSRHSTGSRP